MIILDRVVEYLKYAGMTQEGIAHVQRAWPDWSNEERALIYRMAHQAFVKLLMRHMDANDYRESQPDDNGDGSGPVDQVDVPR